MTTIQSTLTILLVGTVGMTWTACSGDNGAPSDTGPQRDVSVDAKTNGRDAGPEVSVDSQVKARFCGTLEDTQGAPVDGGDIIVCNDHQCLTDTSGSTGEFCVYVSEPDEYVLHVVELTDQGKRWGMVIVPLTLSAAEVESAATIELGKVIVPLMGPGVDLDAQQGGTYDLGGGASLTIAAGATVFPPLVSEAKLALAAVDKTDLHPKLVAALPAGKEPLATFAIMPVGVTFSTPVSFQLPAPAGLAAATALDIYWVDDETGKPELHGEAHEAAGKLVNESGEGLTALGWFVFFAK